MSLAYCGLNCEACPTLIATRTDDDDLRRRVAEVWTAEFGEHVGKTPLEVADMNCEGCLSEGVLFVGCRNCPIRACAAEREHPNCAACDDYATCENLNGFFTIAPEAKEALDRLRAEGRE